MRPKGGGYVAGLPYNVRNPLHVRLIRPASSVGARRFYLDDFEITAFLQPPSLPLDVSSRTCELVDNERFAHHARIFEGSNSSP